MVPLEAPYPGVYIDTFIFFLRSLCKIILMNVHYFPNAPRTLRLYTSNCRLYSSNCRLHTSNYRLYSLKCIIDSLKRFEIEKKLYHIIPYLSSIEMSMIIIGAMDIFPIWSLNLYEDNAFVNLKVLLNVNCRDIAVVKVMLHWQYQSYCH